jgi:hypothetical protein
MMLLLARTGLTTPAVVGRGLSEGLGRTWHCMSRFDLPTGKAQGVWDAKCVVGMSLNVQQYVATTEVAKGMVAPQELHFSLT